MWLLQQTNLKCFLYFIIFGSMQGKQFYDRLNQIRSKYGYFDEKGPSKQTSLSFNSQTPLAYPHTPVATPSPQRQPTASNYRPYLSKNLPFEASHSSTFEAASLSHNTSLIGQNQMRYKQPQAQTQRSLNQAYAEKFQSTFNKAANENLSPSPIKKLGIDSSYHNSPLRKDKGAQREQEYQALRPYNRTYEAGFMQSQKQRQFGQDFKKQRERVRPSKEASISNDIRSKSVWGQETLDKQSLYQRTINKFANDSQRFEFQGNAGSQVALSQKFSYNVNSIGKIQDKINSILHRQK